MFLTTAILRLNMLQNLVSVIALPWIYLTAPVLAAINASPAILFTGSECQTGKRSQI